MKRRWKASIVTGLALAMFAVLPVQAGEGDIIALYKIKGAMTEQPTDMGLGPLLGADAPPNMFDLLHSLKKARSDKNLRAVIFDIEEAQLGLAQIQELRAQFKALRAAKKDVLIFCETLHNGTLMLGSSASQLTLLPTGEVAFNGLYAEGLYFKNLLDKIGLEANIIHCGAYKSAGEPFYLTGPSKEAEEQENRLLDSIFEQITGDIADSRGLAPEKVRELVDVGMFDAKEALEAKLVDKLEYREEFIEGVKKHYGAGAKVVTNYGKKKGPEIDLKAGPFAIFSLFADMMKGPEKSDKKAIAVVYVEGMITSGTSEPSLFGGVSNAGSATVRKAIADAAKDDMVKALILRVDSPGGSAIASEVICEATKRFKASGRPVIVSMGNVAGSGGYYVSTLGDTIFAEPGTITGSIGVVGGKIVTKGLWDWAGVTSHEYKRGKFSDAMNTNRKFSEEEKALIEKFMNRVYAEFKGRVTEGRGAKIKGDLESLAGGRVYTGKEALGIGLVDKLGGFADSVKFTADKADLGSDYELRIFPRPKTFMDMLGEALGAKEKENEFSNESALVGAIGPNFAGLPAIGAAIQALQAVDPAKAAQLKDFVRSVQMLADENVLLVSPGTVMLLR